MSTDTGDTPTDTNTSGLPPAFAHFTEAVDVRLDGDVVVLESTGIPNHPSPYFDRNDANYAEPHDGMQVNPNRILEQDLTLRLPLNPQVASQSTETDLGAIGVAVNGVALFNQYAGRNSTGWLPLDNEIETFDIYNGQPQQRGSEWYENGQPATTRHFQHGHEEGAQQSWTANGTLFSNYVVKDGRRYGLWGSKPCYTVKN